MKKRRVTCASCGKKFSSAHPRAVYCSATCRQRGRRGVKVVPFQAPAADAPRPGLSTATLRELEQADLVDSMLGQAALAMAARIDAGGDTGSAVASLMKELRSTMTEALNRATPAADPVDELRRRREARQKGA